MTKAMEYPRSDWPTEWQAAIDSAREAKQRFQREGERGISWVYFQMCEEYRKAFDRVLVSIQHPLAYEAGTNEYRFKAYVKELAQ